MHSRERCAAHPGITARHAFPVSSPAAETLACPSQYPGRFAVHLGTHHDPLLVQHSVRMQTSPLRHSPSRSHLRSLQHGWMQVRSPLARLMQKHLLSVSRHRASQPVLLGQRGLAAASSVAP